MVTYVMNSARAKYARSEIEGLIRNFGIGDIRSVVITSAWSDGVGGCTWHVENEKDKEILTQYLRNAITAIENGTHAHRF